MAPEVLVPSSPAEAVSLFGDGAATTVIGGGTIVVPEISYGRLSPERVLLLSHAGLEGVAVDGDTITIGATTPINALLGLGRAGPGACRLCGRISPTTRSGARAPSAATSARGREPRRRVATSRARCSLSTRSVRSAGADGESTEPIEDFLVAPARAAHPRCQLPATCGVGLFGARVPAHARVHGACGHGRAGSRRNDPARSHRPRRHGCSTSLRRGGRLGHRGGRGTPPQAMSPSQTMCLPPPGIGSRPCRCSSAAFSPNSRSPHEPHGQRRRYRDRQRSADEPARRAPRGARDHESEGRLRAGRLWCLHRARRRRAPPLVSRARRFGRRCGRHDGRRARLTRAHVARPAGIHASLRRPMRLLYLGNDDGGAGLHRSWREQTTTRRSRRRSAATSADARGTSRSSTRSLPRPAAIRSIFPSRRRVPQ